MKLEETILTWRRLLLDDLLWDDLGFDGKTLMFQLRSLVGMSSGKYAPPQCEMLVPEIVLRLLEEQANTISKVKLNKIGFRVFL